jgi:phosphoribosylglycinamide formyltransferase-1
MSGRIVVLVSGSGSNLVALARACREDRVRGDVVAVGADRNCLGLERAAAYGIPSFVVPFRAYGGRDEWSAALRLAVEAHEPDLVVSAGFMRLLGPGFVDAFAGRLINLHPSLLPAFQGAHAVRDALAAGVKVTGTTVHLVDREVDRGRILFQEPVRVLEGDDEASLHARIKQVEHRLLPAACDVLLSSSAFAGAST